MARLLSMLMLGLSGCNAAPLCSSKIIQVTRDPESDLYATKEVRNCGATTGYTTAVRIGHGHQGRSEATEIFVADTNHGVAREGGGGAIWTSVGWIGPRKLSVTFATNARVFKQLASAQSAAIDYRQADPPTSPPVP